MPKLTVVIGANGAGKTTWCKRNPTRLPEHFYNADSIADGLGGWNNPRKQAEARRLVDTKIQEHLDNNESFGFESTYSGESRPGIVENAAKRGYTVEAIFIGTADPRINIERVKKRTAAGTGHDVPTEEITRRWTAAQETLIKTARSIKKLEILDNSKTVKRVSLLGRKSTYVRQSATPGWAAKLKGQILREDPTLAGQGRRTPSGPTQSKTATARNPGTSDRGTKHTAKPGTR